MSALEAQGRILPLCPAFRRRGDVMDEGWGRRAAGTHSAMVRGFRSPCAHPSPGSCTHHQTWLCSRRALGLQRPLQVLM